MFGSFPVSYRAKYFSTYDVDSAYGIDGSADDSDASTAVDDLRAELARKEEELAIEQQQNEYLADRIAELENQVQSAQDGSVDDDALSQMEDRLREERLSDGGVDSDEDVDEEPQVETVESQPAPSVPKVTTSSATDQGDPWYGNLIMWLIGLLVVAAAVAGWFLSRQGSDDIIASADADSDAGTVSEIKNEAEDILQTLKTDDEADTEEGDEKTIISKGDADDAKTVVSMSPIKKKVEREGSIEDAEVLDEDSADPEVRLDLARAYISMGDREAARVILEEVLEHGTEEQKTEASEMLKEL